MNTRISSGFLFLGLSALVACGGSTVVKTDSTVPPPAPLRLIATVSEQPAFADLLVEELSQNGYGILNPGRTASLLKKMDLDANDMEDPQNVAALKGRRVDALMKVVVEMTTGNGLGGAVSLLDKVKVRVTGVGGETIASLLWRNAWGGAAGSPVDSTIRLSPAAAAKRVAQALVQQLGVPGPKETVYTDDLVVARKTKNVNPGQTTSAGLSADDIARIAKAVQGSVPQEAAVPASNLPISPAPGFQAPERPNDLAVIVGIESYSDIASKASYAERDADAFKAYVLALGVPERNIVLLKGAKAGRASLAKNVEQWLPRLANTNSRVYFYFSGHGAPDVKTGQAYLVPWDGDPNFLESTAYPVAQLYEKLGELPAKQVLVAMDSCFSGAGGRSVLASGARPLVGRIDAGTAPAKLTVLAASASNEISGSLDGQGHGAFTYFLLRGMDAGKTTPKALADYLTPRVQNEARRLNRDQTPQLQGDGSWSLR